LDIKDIGNQVVKDVQAKQYKTAAKKIQSLIDYNADLKESWGGITRLALTIGEYKQAKKCSQKYLELSPDESKRIIQCAAILAEIKQIYEAIALVTPLLKKHRSPEVLHFLGTSYSQIGEIDLAKKYLTELLDMTPNSSISWLTIAAIHKFEKNDNLFSNLISSKSAQAKAPLYWFSSGKAYLDINEYDLAFSHFEKANNMINIKSNYNAKQHHSFIDSIIKNQNSDFFSKIPPQTHCDIADPIFIIGLPRSGTTLLQQILSSHSKINDGGELRCLSYPMMEIGQKKINNLNNLENHIQQKILKKIRDDYFHYLHQQLDGPQPCVDKTLNLNHSLGIITKAFPSAPIIRIVRDLNDTAWSCYRTFFNQGLSWSYNMNNIAEFFYNENRLSEHWSKILNERILEISYEELVNEPTETLTKCFNHVGLTFEHETLSFYNKGSLVQTASFNQIRQPINSNSINTNKEITKSLLPFSTNYANLSNKLNIV